MQNLSPRPDFLSQNLYFHKILRELEYIFRFKKQWCRTVVLNPAAE